MLTLADVVSGVTYDDHQIIACLEREGFVQISEEMSRGRLFTYYSKGDFFVSVEWTDSFSGKGRNISTSTDDRKGVSKNKKLKLRYRQLQASKI